MSELGLSRWRKSTSPVPGTHTMALTCQIKLALILAIPTTISIPVRKMKTSDVQFWMVSSSREWARGVGNCQGELHRPSIGS